MQQTQTRQETTVSEPTRQVVTNRTQVVNPQDVKGTYRTKKAIFHAYQIIWYILGVIEVLLLFRVLLLLFGADKQSGFTNFIYSISAPLALPFAGIFGISINSGSVFEWSTLIAMAIYAVITYGVVSFIQLLKPTNQTEVEEVVDNQ